MDRKPLIQHVRLDTSRMPKKAQEAAAKVADEGGSPRAQIDAVRAVTGKAINYLPHDGAKMRAKRLRQMAAGKLRAENGATT